MMEPFVEKTHLDPARIVMLLVDFVGSQTLQPSLAETTVSPAL